MKRFNYGVYLGDLERERTYFIWLRILGRDIVLEVHIS